MAFISPRGRVSAPSGARSSRAGRCARRLYHDDTIQITAANPVAVMIGSLKVALVLHKSRIENDQIGPVAFP